jgi:hypothetical protein
VVIGDTGEVEIVPSSSPSTTAIPTEPEDGAAAGEETKVKEDSEEVKEEGGEAPVEGEKSEPAERAEEEKQEESG